MAEHLTVEILEQIRDGSTSLRGEVREVRGQLRAELVDVRGETGLQKEVQKQTSVRLERVEDGLRDPATFMREIARAQAEYERFHQHHVEVIENDVADVKQRLGPLQSEMASRRGT